jgi:hypothetical protein
MIAAATPQGLVVDVGDARGGKIGPNKWMRNALGCALSGSGYHRSYCMVFISKILYCKCIVVVDGRYYSSSE